MSTQELADKTKETGRKVQSVIDKALQETEGTKAYQHIRRIQEAWKEDCTAVQDYMEDVVRRITSMGERSQDKRTPLSREQLDTVTVRALEAFLSGEDVTVKKLRGGLFNTKNVEGFKIPYDRFCYNETQGSGDQAVDVLKGIDLDKDILVASGWMEDIKETKPSTGVGGWREGDVVFDTDPENFEEWDPRYQLGQITGFMGRTKAIVQPIQTEVTQIDGDDVEQINPVGEPREVRVKFLTKEQPSWLGKRVRVDQKDDESGAMFSWTGTVVFSVDEVQPVKVIEDGKEKIKQQKTGKLVYQVLSDDPADVKTSKEKFGHDHGIAYPVHEEWMSEIEVVEEEAELEAAAG